MKSEISMLKITQVTKDEFYSWIYLTATFITCFTFIGLIDSIGIIVVVFIEYLNESNAKGGWIGSTAYFLVLALSPIVNYIHDRIGFRWCMFIAMMLYIFSLCVTPFVNNIYLVFLVFAIPFGTSMSIIGTLSITTQRIYFSKYFGLAIGVRFCANSIGSVMLSFILPLVLSKLGYRKTFLSLITIVPILFGYGLVARHRPTRVHKKAKQKSVFSIWKEFLQDKSFVLSLVALAFFFLICLVPLIYMVRYGVTLGFPLSKAKWMLVIRGLSTFITRIIAGRVCDIALKHGKVKIIMGTTITSFGLLNFSSSFFRSFELLLLYMALMGIVEGVFWVTYSVFIVEITGGYHYNEALTFFNLILAVTSIIGSPLSGWIFDQTNDFRYVFYWIFAVCVLAVSLLILSSKVTVSSELSLLKKSQQEEILVCDKNEHENCKLDETDTELRKNVILETTL